MKKKSLVLSIVVVVVMAGLTAANGGEYRIGCGDILEIDVWKNPDLQKRLAVLPDGNIHFPLVKEVRAAEMTVGELETAMVEKLAKFIPEPDLSISVAQVNSLMIYVIGKVNKPGRFLLNSNIDVLQALALAGGLNPFAKEKEIGIFREKEDGTQIIYFNYDQVSKGENLEQNIMLRRGDVIVVR